MAALGPAFSVTFPIKLLAEIKFPISSSGKAAIAVSVSVVVSPLSAARGVRSELDVVRTGSSRNLFAFQRLKSRTSVTMSPLKSALPQAVLLWKRCMFQVLKSTPLMDPSKLASPK